MKKIATKISTIEAALFLSTTVFTAGVAINETGNQPDSSTMLDVQSTNKGLLPPRMKAVQRTGIVSPVAGLMVYQTDAPVGLYTYSGSAWSQVGSGSGTVTNVTASSPLSVTNCFNAKIVGAMIVFEKLEHRV